MKNVYTVAQINTYIKNMFTQDFMLKSVYIKGEVSNCKYHTSGHLYFSLKDASGTIACVMFARQRSGLKFQMGDGMQVIVLGSVNVYERDGKYQIYAETIINEGVGVLYERFEALKKELEEMGMFAPEYKRSIPKFAKKIGVVTASTGAAVQDIIQIATRRNPFIQIVVYPALVQGDGAVQSIVKGIEMFNKSDVDVLIVGRGGGSIEDLWAFNEKIVAEAIFQSDKPVISAVGHETDFTIADYVADMRAPTPSAAAELAVYEISRLDEKNVDYALRIKKAMKFRLQREREKIEILNWKLKQMHPKQKLMENQQRLDGLTERMRQLMQDKIQKDRHKVEVYIAKIKANSPLDKLKQGFSYVENEEAYAVKSVKDINLGHQLKIYVSDGIIKATVTETKGKTYE